MKFLLYATVALLVVSACSPVKNEKTVVSEDRKFSFDLNDLEPVLLEDSSEELNHLNVFKIAPDSTIWLSDGRTIWQYNSEGNLLRKINKQGPAPQEYVKVGNLYFTENYVYVWCSMSLKLIRYDYSFSKSEVFSGPDKAINKFVVKNDSLVYYYESGDYSKMVVEMDLNSGLSREYGKYENEDILLSFRSNSGGLALVGDAVCYMPASALELHKVTPEGDDMTVQNLSDEDFVCNEVKSSTVSSGNGNVVMDAVNYIKANSLVCDLFVDRGGLVVLTETGIVTGNNGEFDVSKRNLTCYFLNSDFTFCKRISIPYLFNTVNCTYFDGCMYVLSAAEDDRYSIYKVSLVAERCLKVKRKFNVVKINCIAF